MGREGGKRGRDKRRGERRYEGFLLRFYFHFFLVNMFLCLGEAEKAKEGDKGGGYFFFGRRFFVIVEWRGSSQELLEMLLFARGAARSPVTPRALTSFPPPPAPRTSPPPLPNGSATCAPGFHSRIPPQRRQPRLAHTPHPRAQPDVATTSSLCFLENLPVFNKCAAETGVGAKARGREGSVVVRMKIARFKRVWEHSAENDGLGFFFGKKTRERGGD